MPFPPSPGGKRYTFGPRRLCVPSRCPFPSFQSSLGDTFRRFRAKLGAVAAITALAHKFARIVYHMLTTREPYDEAKVLATTENLRLRQEPALRKRVRSLGDQIIAI